MEEKVLESERAGRKNELEDFAVYMCDELLLFVFVIDFCVHLESLCSSNFIWEIPAVCF